MCYNYNRKILFQRISSFRFQTVWNRNNKTANIDSNNDVSKMESIATHLSAAIQCIAERGQADLQLFTDGSTMEGTTNGGAGLIIMAGGASINRWHTPTGAKSSSFRTEKTALQAATTFLQKRGLTAVLQLPLHQSSRHRCQDFHLGSATAVPSGP